MTADRPDSHRLLSAESGGPLLSWYDREKRDLPWRHTSDPYAIWVSEIMLQQTQVSTVIPYWNRWMQRFPTVRSLAEADEQEILAHWQGLGYYRRCRLLQQGARFVVEHGLPTRMSEWLKVPGVGRYTAGAIASIALSEPVPLVDGNVERVYARLAGDDAAGKVLHDAAWKWAELNVYSERPGDWNQALMELGATVCRPNSPNCRECPLSGQCVALSASRVEELPAKVAKTKAVQLRHLVCVPLCGDEVGLRQIPAGQWWEGMWEFPRFEVAPGAESADLQQLVGTGWLESAGAFRHSVTHHRIQVEVSYLSFEEKLDSLRWVRLSDLPEVPMPAPQRKALSMVLEQMGRT